MFCCCCCCLALRVGWMRVSGDAAALHHGCARTHRSSFAPPRAGPAAACSADFRWRRRHRLPRRLWTFEGVVSDAARSQMMPVFESQGGRERTSASAAGRGVAHAAGSSVSHLSAQHCGARRTHPPWFSPVPPAENVERAQARASVSERLASGPRTREGTHYRQPRLKCGEGASARQPCRAAATDASGHAPPPAPAFTFCC